MAAARVRGKGRWAHGRSNPLLNSMEEVRGGGATVAGGGGRGDGATKLVGGPVLGEKEKGAPRALMPTSVRAVVEWEGELRGGRC